MEMLQCRFILASLLVLSGCFFEVSCQTVNTYTTKDAESLPCAITSQTVTVTWAETTVGNESTVLTYQMGSPPVITKSTEDKYKNFKHDLTPTSFDLVIEDVEDGDGGVYSCAVFGNPPVEFDVTVEVLVKPTVQYESHDVVELDVIVGTQYNLTCSATRARSVSDLSLMWDPSFEEKSPLITPNGGYKDYSITSTYTAVRDISSITCQLTGYMMQAEINNQRMENIARTVNLTVQYAPVCTLDIQKGEDCTEVTLTCECEAVPAAITQYSFFNGSSNISDGTSNTFTVSVVYGTSTGFSCSATNDIGPGEKSDVKVHDCEKGTTALPTTTIVTTAPMSTNEPTSTKATESTTEKSESTTTKKPDPFPIWVIILIIVVVLAVVIAVIAVIMYKKGEDDSKPSDSSVADGNVTATNVNITSSEPPAPVYGVVKKDSKKKSDQPDDNGAGPGKDPEIPAYGVIDKKKVKDPTPAPRSSMRDSTNSSKPKQEVEMQYADLDHGNKPQSNEVRKPTEEPTEYATVQSVIV